MDSLTVKFSQDKSHSLCENLQSCLKSEAESTELKCHSLPGGTRKCPRHNELEPAGTGS